MHYNVFIANPDKHFIKLEWHITHIHQPIIRLQLPAWRPGRYELANYAKNIRCFSVINEKGENVPYKKLTKDCWETDTSKSKSLTVTYEYYANQYDAGASYADAEQLYINPVNCFMYVEGRMDEACTIELMVPENYRIACQLPVSGKTLTAHDFDQLADSPFIASATLQHEIFTVDKTNIHFWFQGKHEIDVEQLKSDTIAYTKTQTDMFGELPCSDYHFLYHMLNRPFRHGVEHSDSTVIAMGKSDAETRDEFYDSLLAISSHELFHLWNIKRIRPVDMLPYDFTKENYSTLGYVYEGVTTYYGDMVLLRAGAWSWEQYGCSFEGDFKRHIDNPGRFNYSVAESSWDTWLDGYVPGVEGRKVSIYIEGMLAALIADMLIIDGSNGKYGLTQVMRDLYQNYKDGKGYDATLYQHLLEKYAGTSFDTYFNELILGKGHFDKWLNNALNLAGCSLIDVKGHFRLVKNKKVTEKQAQTFKHWTGLSD